MSLSYETKLEISKHANLHEWFAFKDWVYGNNMFNPDEKAAIISYGMSLMMDRYHDLLP